MMPLRKTKLTDIFPFFFNYCCCCFISAPKIDPDKKVNDIGKVFDEDTKLSNEAKKALREENN